MKNGQKHTSVGNLVESFLRGMVQVTNAELYYEGTDETESIDGDEFIRDLMVLNNSGIFSGVVEWKYQLTNVVDGIADFLVYGEFHDTLIGEAVNISLLVNDGFEIEDVKKILNNTIFNEVSGQKNKKVSLVRMPI